MIRTIATILSATLLLSGCVMKRTYERDMGTERALNQQLRTELQNDNVKITQLQDRLRVTMVDELLFPEGGWELHADGKNLLDKIVPTLQNATDHRIEVEGYTDNVPIGAHLRHRFPSNWELSAARAADVVRYLQKQVSGEGESRPVASNATPEGRQANRRTDIDLVPIYRQE